MSDLRLRPFGPDDVEAVDAAHAIRNEVAAADSPWVPPQLRRSFESFLRHGGDGEPPEASLLVAGDRPVGYAGLELPERENTHLGWVTLVVRPDDRRRGFGTATFEELAEQSRAAGRTVISTDGWDGPAATGFAASMGLERRSQAVMRRQHLGEVSLDRVRELFDEASERAADYELVPVVSRSPAELADALVEVSAAINDAPTDDLDIEDEAMSAERLAAYEQATLDAGYRMYRLIARHRTTGELGGHTVVAVEVDRPELGEQHDTAVARSHRGHRLGLLLKSAMVLWLADVEPRLKSLDTWNAESNDHMIAVNEALGYRVMGRELQFQRSL